LRRAHRDRPRTRRAHHRGDRRRRPLAAPPHRRPPPAARNGAHAPPRPLPDCARALMFDLRYHVASLAAVFIALVIGILVGVGIADRGVREDALRRDVADAKSALSSAQADNSVLKQQQQATQDFVDKSYPALMSGRLDGILVGLVFVGSVDDAITSN